MAPAWRTRPRVWVLAIWVLCACAYPCRAVLSEPWPLAGADEGGPLSGVALGEEKLGGDGAGAGAGAAGGGDGRGPHSFTSQLNLSALYGIGGARKGCVARVKGMFTVCRVFLCVRHGAS